MSPWMLVVGGALVLGTLAALVFLFAVLWVASDQSNLERDNFRH